MFSWKKHFLYQIDYQHWANDRLFEALAHLTDPALHRADAPAVGSLLQLLARQHADLQHGWAHLCNQPVPAATEAGDFRAACQALRQDIRGLQHWLEQLPDEFFDSQIAYHTRHHQSCSDWSRDLLSQLLQQLAFRRGQMVALAAVLGAPVVAWTSSTTSAMCAPHWIIWPTHPPSHDLVPQMVFRSWPPILEPLAADKQG